MQHEIAIVTIYYLLNNIDVKPTEKVAKN